MLVEQIDGSCLQIDEQAIVKIENFITLLKKWNGLSLIAKSTENDIWGWHLSEGLSLISFLQQESLPIIDFGAGGGVFGVPLNFCGVKVTPVERSESKLFFLNQIMKIESFALNPYKEFIAIVRGVTRIAELIAILPGAQKLVLFKSMEFEKEIKDASLKYRFEYTVFKRLGIPMGYVVILENIQKK